MKYTVQDKQESAESGLETEDFESILLGEDLSALKSITDLTEKSEEELSASNESLDDLLKAQQTSPKGSPRIRACCEEDDQRPNKPCASRVIDKEGNARITIILGPCERTLFLANVVGLIDSASENDVVDITIVTSPGASEGTISQRSILSAIDRCKAHVITRAGALSTVGEVAIWLSGDELHIPDMGSIFMRQPTTAYMGDAADFESTAADARESMKEFSDYIVERGLFTQDEMDHLYSNRSMLALYGKALKDRIGSLKQLD